MSQDALNIDPQKLRDVAWTLDHLARLMADAVRGAAAVELANADEVEVTMRFTSEGDDWWNDPDEAQRLLDWVEGTEMQDELRQWADVIERLRSASSAGTWA